MIIFEEDTPWKLIQQIKPDILVKGGDYNYQEVVGRDLVDTVVFYNTRVHISTTEIINYGNQHRNDDQPSADG